MQNLVFIIIAIAIIIYFIFLKRTKSLYDAIDKIISGKLESVKLKQSLEQIRNTIQAQFKNVISTDKTILFRYKNFSFIVVPINEKEILISFEPSSEEIENFEKLENEIKNIQEEEDLSFVKDESKESIIKNKIEEFNYTLPIYINERIKFIQVFGNEENIWLIFQVPKRNSPEEDTKAINYLVNIMKKNDFVQYLNRFGTEISIQIIAENQQNVATSSIKFDNELKDIQPIINKLNTAELDYLDIANVYQNPLLGDTILTFEMNNEENFFLIFDNIEDMQIALDLINYKINIIPSNDREEYFEELNLDELLIDFPKMSFEDFINQYELDNDRIEAIYRWKENNDEKDREDKIIDFNGYSLGFINISGNLIATLIHQTEDTISDEERRKKEELQKEIDEIPF